MNTLYIKVQGFEEQSHSLIVSFASDVTKSQNPDDYPSYAYQPMNMWPDVTDPQEILKRIAVSGVYQVEQQARNEAFVDDENLINALKALVSQSTQYKIDDLIPSQPASTEINNIQVV
jgi:hypothetical protein